MIISREKGITRESPAPLPQYTKKITGINPGMNPVPPVTILFLVA
jgi:hypothetical protein